MEIQRAASAPLLHVERPDATYPLLSLLERSALLRDDLRGAHPGIPLDLRLRLLDAGTGAPLRDAAVYLQQHRPAALRGVQISDADGRVQLRTLRPPPGIDGTGSIELQISLTHAGLLRAIARTTLVLPGLRRSDPAPPHAQFDTPVRLLTPAPQGDPRTGQTLELEIALAGLPDTFTTSPLKKQN